MECHHCNIFVYRVSSCHNINWGQRQVLRMRKCFHSIQWCKRAFKSNQETRLCKKESATFIIVMYKSCVWKPAEDYPWRGLRDCLWLRRVMQLLLTIARANQDDWNVFSSNLFGKIASGSNTNIKKEDSTSVTSTARNYIVLYLSFCDSLTPSNGKAAFLWFSSCFVLFCFIFLARGKYYPGKD